MELEKYQKIFIEESGKYLEELDSILMEVEKDHHNQQLWGEIHGKIHSIKGMSKALSLNKLADLCHALEEWCKAFQQAAKEPTENVMRLMFDGTDLIKQFVEGKGNITSAEDLKTWQTLIDTLAKGPESLELDSKPKARSIAFPSKINRIRVDYALIEELLARSQEIILLEKTLPPLTQEQMSSGLQNWISHYISMLKGLYFQLAQLRLMPVRDFMDLFGKTVHDLANAYQREVTLDVVGGDIQVDLGLMERLREPFMHLLRNAIAHGIEPSNEREATGKPREGKVVLEAERSGDHLLLSFGDDGRGIDVEAIRTFLKDRKGLNSKDIERLSNKEILEIICRNDFSSADGTTQLAGRGVGMNVVAQAIEYLGGAMSVHTEPGKGTRFVMKLPLSLSIIYAVIFRLDKFILAIPTSHVETIENELSDSTKENVCLIDLRRLFKIDNRPEKYNHIIRLRALSIPEVGTNGDVVEYVAADVIIGNMPLMAMPVGEFLAKTGFFAGVGIMENGEIALVLDMERIQSAPNK